MYNEYKGCAFMSFNKTSLNGLNTLGKMYVADERLEIILKGTLTE